jgi:aspartokinase-like uncharacterized kinase
MELSAHALAALMSATGPRPGVVEDVAGLAPVWRAGRTPILAPRRFLEEDDGRADALPPCWGVTSDSIAARVAVRLGARELVLLKSVTPPTHADRADAARLGLVDAEFPRVSAAIERVLFLNLRDPEARSARAVPG